MCTTHLLRPCVHCCARQPKLPPAVVPEAPAATGFGRHEAVIRSRSHVTGWAGGGKVTEHARCPHVLLRLECREEACSLCSSIKGGRIRNVKTKAHNTHANLEPGGCRVWNGLGNSKARPG